MNPDTFRLTLPPGTYTALFIWQRILEIVREEPKRLDMGTWTTMFKGEDYEQWTTPHEAPACGTIHCLAGWYTHVAGLLDAKGLLPMYPTTYGMKRKWHPLAVAESLGVETKGSTRCELARNMQNEGPGVRALFALFFESFLHQDEATKRLENIITDHLNEFEAIRVTVR